MEADTMFTQWPRLIKQLQDNPDSLPVSVRQQLADSLGQELLQGTIACNETLFLELAEQLTKDPDWQVRLAVSRQLYLFDPTDCTDLIIRLCSDDNTYVRKNAERGLNRQVKFKQKRSKESQLSKDYLAQIKKLVGQYGPDIADKVHLLAEYRYSLLASTLAHDFRSVLTTLSANVEALLKEHPRHKRTKSIQDDLVLLEQTIENMELFVKPLNVVKQYENIDEIIDAAVEKAKVKIAKLGYDISCIQLEVPKPERIRINISRPLLLLALTNLIKNAYESFASDGQELKEGTIRIHVIVRGYEIQIIVKDDGPGIEPQILDKLSAFMPIDINKTKRESTGFGVCTAYRYIVANNGTFEIDSQVDVGTTITMTFPLKDTDTPEETP
ncbi:MAG TPA: ATP-binding protein [Anaerohalosphaeraceae bacterium]|nr:ATP-binding protein [Anaerohalosphaeraceae bacterium]HOL30555.1 ATP-binding protein [Anaerohalosphaeraceae bacterium]HOM75193.1 ATP-binding protein [Anaerohalosphaeraceae bacterium]HPC64013.1 ATP-binding protein [Anaerohalosphaeraceae bacterium]HPO70459.1 ATP-binding protein [Anaerohalosphaeraceae bacterium]